MKKNENIRPLRKKEKGGGEGGARIFMKMFFTEKKKKKRSNGWRGDRGKQRSRSASIGKREERAGTCSPLEDEREKKKEKEKRRGKIVSSSPKLCGEEKKEKKNSNFAGGEDSLRKGKRKKRKISPIDLEGNSNRRKKKGIHQKKGGGEKFRREGKILDGTDQWGGGKRKAIREKGRFTSGKKERGGRYIPTREGKKDQEKGKTSLFQKKKNPESSRKEGKNKQGGGFFK